MALSSDVVDYINDDDGDGDDNDDDDYDDDDYDDSEVRLCGHICCSSYVSDHWFCWPFSDMR